MGLFILDKMARINIIPPELLTDQHLIAEKREINLAISIIRKIKNKNIPKSYTLNKGHVLFFSNKVKYLKKRYSELEKEIGKRNFVCTSKFVGEDLMEGSKDFVPSIKDYKIIVERIKSKIKIKPNWYRYNGKPIDEKKYLKELRNLID